MAKARAKQKKRPRGRPTKYRQRFVGIAKKLCAQGFTDPQLAEFFEVNPISIQRWRAEHEDFCIATARSKELADDMVEASLFQRAVGYSHKAVKIFMPAGAEKPVMAPYVEHHPPDTTAARLWLLNRRPKAWRDRIEHAGDPNSPLFPAEALARRAELVSVVVNILDGRAAVDAALPVAIEGTVRQVPAVVPLNGAKKPNGHGR